MEHKMLWTVKEVATLFRVSELTVYKYIWSGTLPGLKIGKKQYVTGKIIDEVLAGTRVIEPAPHATAAPAGVR